MYAVYKGKCVIGSSFSCTIVTIFLFFLGMIFVPLSTYQTYAVSTGHATILLYIPLIALGVTVIYLYFKTSLTDPGVIPKRIIVLIDNQFNETVNMEQQQSKQNALRVKEHNKTNNASDPLDDDEKKKKNEYVINSTKMSYYSQSLQNFILCETCLTEKPPGVAHCKDCNHCVVFHDHHCPWMGTCIGMRNYYYFYQACWLTFAYCVSVMAYCGVGFGLSFVDKYNNNNVLSAIACKIIQLGFGILGGFGLLFGLSMVAHHLHMIKNDITTRAELKHRLNVHDTLEQNAKQLDIALDNLISKAINEDPILKTLDLNRYKNPGTRRMIYGRLMPVLRTLPLEEAQLTAWRWTLVLGGAE